ncbi:MAG TPA: NADPH-dependent FMN reductase [Solirubrobacteraceae bacterium]|jgi:chromate reductase|nr:NADPH-dependent FMN reductase [Solirubrobacteraceae bacterium]
MRILGLSGSLRRASHNTRLLRGLTAMLPQGVELEVFDRLGEIPPFNEDDEHTAPPAVAALKAAIAGADAVIVATPEYNASIPGALKNALDWVSRPSTDQPLQGKPALVVGASMGLFGAVWAQAELRKVLSTMGARVVDRELPVAQAHETLGEDGLPQEQEAREVLESMVSELIDLARPERLVTA